ncbi:MAG TPA: DinB family protein, partial [Candidatus Acidoferrales bacterium]|nr:DinB family protein [Candidatus Acidoferrales bacterium]
TWDQEAVARERDDCRRPAAELLGELASQRRSSVELVRSLGPAQLDRGGRHPQVGRLTVRELLHEWVHHDRAHLRQQLAVVQAYAWQSMGNAQKFQRG